MERQSGSWTKPRLGHGFPLPSVHQAIPGASVIQYSVASWRVSLLELRLVYTQPPQCLCVSVCCLTNWVGTYWSPGRNWFASFLGHMTPLICNVACLQTHHLNCVSHKNVSVLHGLKWLCCFCLSKCGLCFGWILHGNG